MGNKRRAAAIFAGLSGCAVWSVPVLASAAPLGLPDDLAFIDVTMDDLLASPVAYFAVGVMAGGVVVGLAMGIARHRSTKRYKRALAEASRQSGVIRIQAPGHVLDLDGGDGGRPGPTRGTADDVADGGDDTSSPAEPELDTTADLGGARDGSGRDAAGEQAQASVALAAAPEAPDVPDAQVPEPEPAAKPAVPAPAPAPRLTPTPATSVPMGRPSRVSARLDALLPTFDDYGGAAEPPVDPAQDTDYAAVAESYVQGKEAHDRKQRRSRGVRSVLSERLGGNMMEGLPVIERADGSTTDIGTSWWEKTVGSTHAFTPLDSTAQLGMVPVDEAGDPMATSELRLRELARAERNARVAGLSSASTFGGIAVPEERADRAATIASRVPSFDLSLYPDEGDGGSADGEDMFEQAMRALDAQLPSASVTTSEDAASVTTPLSDDLETGYVVSPESLGSTTAEDGSVDVEAYVDYLVRDEMERRHSSGTRHHSFLTVFEGTGDLSDATRRASSPAPKHLSTPRKQREA